MSIKDEHHEDIGILARVNQDVLKTSIISPPNPIHATFGAIISLKVGMGNLIEI
jgi:hypothetical protein